MYTCISLQIFVSSDQLHLHVHVGLLAKAVGFARGPSVTVYVNWVKTDIYNINVLGACFTVLASTPYCKMFTGR